MQRHRTRMAAFVALLLVCTAAPHAAARTRVKPGFNLFSPQQEVQLGREAAAAQAERQLTLSGDPALNSRVRAIGQRLVRHSPCAQLSLHI